MKESIQIVKMSLLAAIICLNIMSCTSGPKLSFLGSWEVKSGGPPTNVVIDVNGDVIINGRKGVSWTKKGDHIEFINPHSGKPIVGILTQGGILRLVGTNGHVQVLERK